MKPFDLEAFKTGAVALTRGGEQAHFIAVRPDLIKCNQHHNQLVFCYEPNGFRLIGTRGLDCLGGNEWGKATDLVGMKPTEVIRWVNVYLGEYGYRSRCSYFYDSEEHARTSVLSEDYVGTFTIEIEE